MMVNSVHFVKTPLTLFVGSFKDLEYVTDILKKYASLTLNFVFRQNGRLYLVILT